MKIVPVEYIESGTFVGGEEDVYNAGIEPGEVCVAMPMKSFKVLRGMVNDMYENGATNPGVQEFSQLKRVYKMLNKT